MANATPQKATQVSDYHIEEEPFYLSTGNEIEVAHAAYQNQIPLMLKGPTGCGKTRFMRYMAWRLGRPLVTVACHDDLTTSDLVGRYIIKGGETAWIDGPLTMAVTTGAICYLDEVVEARKDTTVVIHPLADDRRILTIEKRDIILQAPPEFMLTISYNPGYQSAVKDLKPSTRQRFIGLTLGYPPRELAQEIVMHEGGVDSETARDLVTLAEKIANLKDKGLEEVAGTRLLVHAASLISSGIEPRLACNLAIASPVTDDTELSQAISEIISAVM